MRVVLGRTYITASINLLEAVKVSFKSLQVLFLYIAEQVLDGQSGHLDGGGGVHGCYFDDASCWLLQNMTDKV